uniref:centromere protein P n=1 Tax=Myxine glutinosa TaxID=7769 RepID=UPI00358F1A25
MEVAMLTVAEKRIMNLKADITKLEHQLKEKEVQNFQKNQLPKMRTLLCEPQGTPPDLEVLEENLQTMQLLQKLHEEMTGFRFWNLISGPSRQGPQGNTRSCRFKGEGFSLLFQMELVIEEPPAEKPFTAGEIKHLEIVFDMQVSRELTSLSSRAEETCNFMLFLRTLHRFGCWANNRSTTFCHLLKEFPSVVSLPEGENREVLSLENPTFPWLKLLIRWRIKVTADGNVIPKLTLSVNTEATRIKRDRNGFLRDAPKRFQQLLKLNGVEATTRTFALFVSDL